MTGKTKELRSEAARLLALADAHDDGTAEFYLLRRTFTAKDLAMAIGVSVEAANNRLARLHRLHLLVRCRTPVSGGGKQFVYERSGDWEMNVQ